MFNFLKKLAGGGKEGSCGASACGSTKTESSCSSQPKEVKMAGSCGAGACHSEDDHTAPKGACH